MSRSALRPETRDSDKPSPSNGTAYLLIYNAVQQQDGLIHGRLHDRGASCAIGSFFDAQPNASLPFSIIDEVAMVNDSIPPNKSRRQRKLAVSRWLRWKLGQLGMPGFTAKVKGRS